LQKWFSWLGSESDEGESGIWKKGEGIWGIVIDAEDEEEEK